MSKFTLRDLRERQEVARAVVVPLLKGKRDRTVGSIYERIRPSAEGFSHTVLSPVGTSTFRLSSSESPLFDNSTNWQNMAKKVAKMDELYHVRDVVIPDPGMVLLAGDYKGAEAVMVAAYSKDWMFLEKLLNGADVHTEHAQHFFDTDTPTPMQRDIGKTITYASFYHAQPRTIAERMNKDADITGILLSVEEVTRLRAILLQLHTLEQWWADTRIELDRSAGILRNCFGFRRVFRDPDPDYRLKDGLAFYPQSSIAWLINEVIESLEHVTIPADCLLQVHDELVFQCRPEHIPSLIHTLTPIYQRHFKVHGHELYVPVEWKTGPTWGSMTELKL